MKKLIFNFILKNFRKTKDSKDILGGKGANLAEMGKWVFLFRPVLQYQLRFVNYFSKIKKKFQKLLTK